MRRRKGLEGDSESTLMATPTKPGTIEQTPDMLQFCSRHYSVGELAEMWNLSPNKVREMFQHEPGVLAIANLARSLAGGAGR